MTRLLSLISGLDFGKLVEIFSKVFAGFFVYRSGKNSEKLDNVGQELEDSREAAKVKSGIAQLPSTDIDNLL